MNPPRNERYVRRYPHPEQWPSNTNFGAYAAAVTQQRVNELSWELAGHQLADEIEFELTGGTWKQSARPMRAGEPGE